MKEHGNSRNVHGTTISGNGWIRINFSFDGMLAGCKEVHTKRRNMFHYVDPDEEEQEHDHVAEECEIIDDK